MDSDLANVFQYFMVYYDLNKLSNYQSIDFSPENQVLLVQQSTKEEPVSAILRKSTAV